MESEIAERVMIEAGCIAQELMEDRRFHCERMWVRFGGSCIPAPVFLGLC